MKIQIKNRFVGSVIFEHEQEQNSIKITVLKALEAKISLCGADLRGADLCGADLCGADLRGADLRSANLCSANLYSANLCSADLRSANLCSANLCSADLYSARNVPSIPLTCPSDGAFTGWKKVGKYLIELEIPADAKRSSATGRKCRCDKAKVLSIRKIGDESEILQEIENNSYKPSVTYKAEETVYPDSFDEDRWNECSHGIHFFINKQEAINY